MESRIASVGGAPHGFQMFKTAVDVSVLMVLPSVFLPNALEACDYKLLPPGVIALGVTKVAFDICPKLVDISMDGKNDGTANLYSGFWWEKTVPERSQYSDNPDGSLSISFNASLATVPRTMVPGALPLLAGDRRFFVEFEVLSPITTRTISPRFGSCL